MKNQAILLSLTAGLCMFVALPAAQAQSPQQATLNNLNAMGLRIVQRLDAGKAAGTISVQAAAEFTAELARIQTLTSQYANDGNGLTFSEAQILTSNYGQLEARVNSSVAAAPFNPGAGIVAGQDVEARINQMQARISGDLTAGAITNDQAYELRQQVYDVFQRWNTLKVNGLTSWERHGLLSDLDRVESRIGANYSGHGRWGGYSSYRPSLNLSEFDTRQAQILSRIQQSTGRLSRWQTDSLMRAYSQLQDRAARFRNTGARLSRGELRSLENRQDELEDDLDHAIRTAGRRYRPY